MEVVAAKLKPMVGFHIRNRSRKGMKLVELDPQFIRLGEDGGHVHVGTLLEAQGIRFSCPCGQGDAIAIWFQGRGVDHRAAPHSRWHVGSVSTGYADLTLAPSINVVKHWHGFITTGEIVNA